MFSESSICAVVGQNAAGKSNLVQALKLVSDLSKGELLSQHSVAALHSELFNLNEGNNTSTLEAQFESLEGGLYRYSFNITLNEESKAPWLRIDHEKLEVRTDQGFGAIFTRTGSVLKDSEGRDIPLALQEEKLALAQYNSPSVKEARDSLSSIHIVETELSSIKKIIGLAGERATLAGIVADLMVNNEEEFSRYKRIIKKINPAFSEFTNVSIPSPGNDPKEKKRYLVFLVEEGFKDGLSMGSLSAGDIRTLLYIAQLISVNEGSVVVIEEIENGLHYKRLSDLIEYVKNIAAKRDLQVIFTTHSSSVIDKMSPDSVLFVEKKSQEGTVFTLLSQSKETAAINDLLREGGTLSDYLKLSSG